jgi:hypothetical protein
MCLSSSSIDELLMSHSCGAQGKLIEAHHVFLANFRVIRVLAWQYGGGVCGYRVRSSVWAGLTSAQDCLNIFWMSSLTCLAALAGRIC